MADILIKKMKMPKACYWIDSEYNSHSCPLMEFGHLCQANGACVEGCTEERHDDCPLVEVPPHGRLIDADKMELDFRASVANLIEKYPDAKNIFSEYERLVIGILNKTPTVVEASK